MFGAHLSVAGGLHNALIAAHGLRMQCVQVFTKNQKQWAAAPLRGGDVEVWRRHRRETRVEQVVSHDSYLINLASPSAELWEKSIGAFREELLRCEALDVPLLVTHPGAHLGEGEAAGLRRVAAALDRLHRDLPGIKTVTCLEITAGQGSCLGCSFEHLAEIIGLVAAPERLAVCLDTAHLLAAGYDLTSKAGAMETIEACERLLGRGRVRVLHLNDSKVPRGSRVDRHEHIGQGHVSLGAFRVFVNHPSFKGVPKILETPKGDHPESGTWDAANLAALKGLRRGARPAKASGGRSPTKGLDSARGRGQNVVGRKSKKGGPRQADGSNNLVVREMGPDE